MSTEQTKIMYLVSQKYGNFTEPCTEQEFKEFIEEMNKKEGWEIPELRTRWIEDEQEREIMQILDAETGEVILEERYA